MTIENRRRIPVRLSFSHAIPLGGVRMGIGTGPAELRFSSKREDSLILKNYVEFADFGLDQLTGGDGCSLSRCMQKPPGSYVEDFALSIDGPESEDENAAYRRGYIDACRDSLRIMNNWALTVVQSPRPMVATWQIASALGLSVAVGKSDSEIASICGVASRACISKGRIIFQRANNIKPLPSQKSTDARKAYSLKRS